LDRNFYYFFLIQQSFGIRFVTFSCRVLVRQGNKVF